MSNRVLLILGMHRSGTSLVSQWIHNCGINLGDRLLGAAPSNKHGHFEDRDFLDIHNQILVENGYTNEGLCDIKPLDINNYYLSKIRYNVELKNSLNYQWGWKEPRTCLFVKEYNEIIETPIFLILFRSADLVVDSLLRRRVYEEIQLRLRLGWREVIKLKLFRKKIIQNLKKKYTDRYFDAWISYNERLLSFVNENPNAQYLAVDYERLIKKDLLVLDWLKKSGFNINPQRFNLFFDDKLIKRETTTLEVSASKREKVNAITKKFEKLLQ